MKHSRRSLWCLAALPLSGCVTIGVPFPGPAPHPAAPVVTRACQPCGDEAPTPPVVRAAPQDGPGVQMRVESVPVEVAPANPPAPDSPPPPAAPAPELTPAVPGAGAKRESRRWKPVVKTRTCYVSGPGW